MGEDGGIYYLRLEGQTQKTGMDIVKDGRKELLSGWVIIHHPCGESCLLAPLY